MTKKVNQNNEKMENGFLRIGLITILIFYIMFNANAQTKQPDATYQVKYVVGKKQGEFFK